MAKHCEEIFDAFLEYFAGLDGAALGENQGKAPPNPSPVLWGLHGQMDRWRQLPNPGGLLDQPYILMAELDQLDRVIAIRRRQKEKSQT